MKKFAKFFHGNDCLVQEKVKERCILLLQTIAVYTMCGFRGGAGTILQKI